MRSTPARHVDRRAFRPGPDHDRDTGERLPDMPSLGEVERRLVAVDDRLAELVELYADANDRAAEAKADWEAHRSRAALALANSGEKSNEDVRMGTALGTVAPGGQTGEDLHRTYLVTEAAADNLRKALSATQARLSSLQSLMKGLKAVTGLDA